MRNADGCANVTPTNRNYNKKQTGQPKTEKSRWKEKRYKKKLLEE